jgi:hypothetical protein
LITFFGFNFASQTSFFFPQGLGQLVDDSLHLYLVHTFVGVGTVWDLVGISKLAVLLALALVPASAPVLAPAAAPAPPALAPVISCTAAHTTALAPAIALAPPAADLAPGLALALARTPKEYRALLRPT